jgi:hypothetical protein
MKIFSPKQSGGILVVTIVVTSMMGVALASYLNLVQNQNLSTMRSQQWNLALPIAEAGIEEALAHLADVTTNNRAVNNWTLTADRTAVERERWIGSNKFVVKITTNEHPSITVEGYACNPNGIGLMTTPRTVRVQTTNAAMFAKGMVAKGLVDLKGNNIETDSFDSSNTNFSTNGRYDPAKRRAKGDIATNSGLTNSLNVGNAKIRGKAATGPGGSVKVGSLGGVGDDAWYAAGNTGVQTNSVTDDMNVSFPDVKEPPGGGYSYPNPRYDIDPNYAHYLNGGKYQMAVLTLTGSQIMYVAGDSLLWVTVTINISGNAKIVIAPGASLKLYMSGVDTYLGGNGVANETGSAFNFQYYGLPSNTSVVMGGNTSFTGTIYAPGADFSLGGGGSDTYDFVGGSVTKTVQMNGHFRFHYDEALEPFGARRGYVITTWNEI